MAQILPQQVFIKPSLMSNFLKIYFHYCFYFGLCPFHFSWKHGKFSVKSNPIQKIVCVATHLFSVVVLLRDLQSKLIQPSSTFHKNPVKYFHLMDSLFNFIYKFTLLKRFWLNQPRFEQIMNFLANQESFHSGLETQSKLQNPVFIHAIMLFYTLVAVSSLICGKNFVSSLDDLSPRWWYRRLVVLGRYTFFIDWKMQSGAPELANITLWENVIGVITGAGLLSRFLLGFFIDLCILTMACTLWTVCINFTREIEFNPFENWIEYNPKSQLKNNLAFVERISQTQRNPKAVVPWAQIYAYFDSVRILANLLNEAIGSLVIWFVLEALMYYSVNMDGFLVTKDIFKKCYLFAYYIGTVGIFSFSSNVCQEVIWFIK